MLLTYDCELSNGSCFGFHINDWAKRWETGTFPVPPGGYGRKCELREHDDGRMLVHGMTWPAESAARVTSYGEMVSYPCDRLDVQVAVQRIAGHVDIKMTELLARSLADALDELFDCS